MNAGILDFPVTRAIGRHSPNANKAISVGFIAATLRLPPRLLKGGCGGQSLGGELAKLILSRPS